MTDKIEYSRYETMALTKKGAAYINIYRTKGVFDWTLEIECTWKKENRIIIWPNSFLSDKTAQDTAKKKLIDQGLLSSDFEKFAVTAGDVEDFMRKKGKRFERRARS